MKRAEELKSSLHRIDGRGYKAYKQIKGSYDFGRFQLFIDHVQGDPFAAPSRVRVRVAQSLAGFPHSLYENKIRKVALEDYLTRAFARAIRRTVEGRRGSGRSGLISIVEFGQAVLERTAMEVNQDFVEASFSVGLPASGRRILGREAIAMFFEEIPAIVEGSLVYGALPAPEIEEHVKTVEDASYIRENLENRGLVAFIANGAILPRESGISDRPMRRAKVVPFRSPESLEVEFHTPNHGGIRGMGIPQGITLIVGGGYHGKSTLLNALANGVYNHIPGDGREFVVTIADAVVIRAEDGRFTEKVDISPFITYLPSGEDTRYFSTQNASGSTSQAANIVEAVEVGARLLLIDEDTSATNFMIRDRRMQELVAKDKEPITPLIDKIRLLYQDLGVSTILVMGGSGDYFDVADTVIMMDSYQPRDVTQEAKLIAQRYRYERHAEGGEHFGSIRPRRPVPQSINPRKGSGKLAIKARGRDTLQFGDQNIDLSKLHQIVELPQVRSIGWLIWHLGQRILKDSLTLREALDRLEREVATKGFRSVLQQEGGDYALPRRYEVAAALNRLRTLKCESK